MPIGPLCGLTGFDASAEGFACIDGMYCKVSDPEEKQHWNDYCVANSATIAPIIPGKTL
jgi:hypothetical protein